MQLLSKLSICYQTLSLLVLPPEWISSWDFKYICLRPKMIKPLPHKSLGLEMYSYQTQCLLSPGDYKYICTRPSRLD